MMFHAFFFDFYPRMLFLGAFVCAWFLGSPHVETSKNSGPRHSSWTEPAGHEAKKVNKRRSTPPEARLDQCGDWSLWIAEKVWEFFHAEKYRNLPLVDTLFPCKKT